jgi:glycosyltransferase involved in cell wall biosynthesis
MDESHAALERQVFRDYEVIVLDNASPPDAVKHIQQWARKLGSTARIMRSEQRLPVYANFNRGILAARGKYIAFFHDDDIYHPEFLARTVEQLERVPDACIAGTNYDVIDEMGRVTGRRRPFRRTEAMSGREYIMSVLRTGRSPIPMQGVVYRRAALPEAGFDVAQPTHFGDFVLLMRLVEQGSVATLRDVLLQVRKHESAASQIPYSRAVPMRTKVLLAFCREYAERHSEIEVDRLVRWVERGHRVSLLYGWFAAADDAEARACADYLGASVTAERLRVLLRALDKVRIRRASKLWRRLGRRVGEAAGL